MPKRIVICADGTWNRPEEDLDKDFPTNVLRLARAIKPVGSASHGQQVFYDWGVGSYHDQVTGGAFGKGLHKNIVDDYRYIVQNYAPGDDIFLFGFSRGAYTVRCLSGLINNLFISYIVAIIASPLLIWLRKKHAPDWLAFLLTLLAVAAAFVLVIAFCNGSAAWLYFFCLRKK